MEDIMSMKTGTRLKNVRSGAVYILGGYVNEVACEITAENYSTTNFINKNTQNDYIVERTCENGIST